MVYCTSPKSSTVQGKRWSRAEHIYINKILKSCGGFLVFPPGAVRTHLKTSVQKYLDLHRRETTRPLNFLSPLPIHWGSPSLGAPWVNAQAWHLQEQHTARCETLIHSSSGSPHLYPGTAKSGHLTARGKQGCLQRGTPKGHCTSVHTSSPPYRSESTFPVLLTPSQFQVSHGVTGISRKYNGLPAPLQKGAWEVVSPSTIYLTNQSRGSTWALKKIKVIQPQNC